MQSYQGFRQDAKNVTIKIVKIIKRYLIISYFDQFNGVLFGMLHNKMWRFLYDINLGME